MALAAGSWNESWNDSAERRVQSVHCKHCLAVLRLIGAGLFDRDPLIVAAHLGGVLSWLRDRLAIYGQPILPGLPPSARPVSEYLDRIYVDTVGYGPAPLAYCYTQLGPAVCC